jgi:methionyl-tRNA formyltransferase
MNIGFFGTPEHSKILLEKILSSGHSVSFVVTNPDKPQGRKKILTPSPVKSFALEKGIPVLQPIKLRSPEAIEEVLQYSVDINIVYAYGSIIPKEIFEFPRLKSINLHGSVLPEYRGASPVQTALLDGKNETGFSIQFVAEAVDSGDVIYSESFPVEDRDTSGSLLEKITDRGSVAILKLLENENWEQAKPQDSAFATHCKKIQANDRILDFTQSAKEVHDRVRALNPNPIAYTNFREKRINIIRTTLVEEKNLSEDVRIQIQEASFKIGELFRPEKKSLFVICGDKKMISIEELQPEGKKVMKIQDFLNGFSINKGECFQ